jgi:hypothetical protein
MTVRPWEQFTKLGHIADLSQRKRLEARRRHRQVRYLLFRMQNEIGKGELPEAVEGLPPGFVEFWLGETPEYMVQPQPGSDQLVRVPVPSKLQGEPVAAIGGYPEFAKRWDVDEDLAVYLRWSSVWQEWNAVLARVAPILGD